LADESTEEIIAEAIAGPVDAKTMLEEAEWTPEDAGGD